MTQFKWDIFYHIPYSLDLVRVIFTFFPSRKIFWVGAAMEVTMNWKKVLMNILTSFGGILVCRRQGIEKLVKRYNKCLN